MQRFSMAIHGGAGTLVKGLMTAQLEREYKNALNLALNKGYAIVRIWGKCRGCR